MEFPSFEHKPATAANGDFYQHNEAGIYLVSNWIVRGYLPEILEEAGFVELAAPLRNLPATTQRLELVETAMPVLDTTFTTLNRMEREWFHSQRADGVEYPDQSEFPYKRALRKAHRVKNWVGSVLFGEYGTELAASCERFMKKRQQELAEAAAA